MAILSNNASYGSDFTTVLRAAYGAVLSIPVQLQDMHGASPLPKDLGSAKVSWSAASDGKRTTHPESSGTQVAQDAVQSNAVDYVNRI